MEGVNLQKTARVFACNEKVGEELSFSCLPLCSGIDSGSGSV